MFLVFFFLSATKQNINTQKVLRYTFLAKVKLTSVFSLVEKLKEQQKKLQVRFFVAAETFHASVNFSCHIFASCLQYQWRDMRTAL